MYKNKGWAILDDIWYDAIFQQIVADPQNFVKKKILHIYAESFWEYSN